MINKDLQPLVCFLVGLDPWHQNAARGLPFSADATAQLMQLRKAELLGMLDNQQRSV